MSKEKNSLTLRLIKCQYVCLGWKGPELKVACIQQCPAQTLAWDRSMLLFTPSCCVLLGLRAWCCILQVFHDLAKAQRKSELFGLRLGWGPAVTLACDTVELGSALCLLPKMLCCKPQDCGTNSCQRSAEEAPLQGFRRLLFKQHVLGKVDNPQPLKITSSSALIKGKDSSVPCWCFILEHNRICLGAL